MSKKKISLGNIMQEAQRKEEPTVAPTPVIEAVQAEPESLKKGEGPVNSVKTSIYLPEAAKDQLEQIQFEERKSGKSQNDLLLEALDLLFKGRGLPTIEKLTS